jgi:hypothetical protein
MWDKGLAWNILACIRYRWETCEKDKEHSCSLKRIEFLDWFLKHDAAVWSHTLMQNKKKKKKEEEEEEEEEMQQFSVTVAIYGDDQRSTCLDL